MGNLLTVSKPESPKRPVFLHEFRSHMPRRHGYDSRLDIKTTLFVVFDGDTQRHFSSVRIILYCHGSRLDRYPNGPWEIRPLEPTVTVAHSSRDHISQAPENNPTLPQLTVAFEVFPRICGNAHVLFPPPPEDKLRCHWGSKSARILLESKHTITPDTLSISVPFQQHSVLLWIPSNQPLCCHHNPNDVEYVTTRTVRVVANGARPKITISCLTTELLLKILEATDSCTWQYDLLSFAQVCRQWSECSMKVLFARLEASEWRNYCNSFPSQYLDPCAFARAISKTPSLRLGVQHLYVDQHNGSLACWKHPCRKMSPGFTPALIAILRATKNLQRLHLSQGYSSKGNAFFSALPKLDHLHTLSITQTTCETLCSESATRRSKYWKWSVNTVQLAHCMARWPALTSLTVENIAPGNIGMAQIFLRPPTCALTQLCIRNSYISDRDLWYLTNSSANTLTQVTLDRLQSLTYDGLHAFLDSISRNVTSLTILQDCCPCQKRKRALDDVVDKMWCLEALNIRWDVASELMLRRRSEMFVRRCGSGVPVPVVRLSFQSTPGIRNCVGHEWAGWELVELD